MVSKELAEIINVLDDTNKIVLKGSDEDKKQKLKECFGDVVIRSFGKEFKSLEEYEEYMKTICDCDDPKPYRPEGITAMMMKPHQCQTCGRFPHKKYMS